MASDKSSGRFTPKAPSGPTKGRGDAARADSKQKPEAATRSVPASTTGRYTPPAPRPETLQESAAWVAPLMFALFLIGLAVIVLNLTEVLPGAPNNWFTLGGLAVILVGFLTATRLR